MCASSTTTALTYKELVVGLGNALPEWLAEQVFKQPIVQASMTEIDKNAVLQEKEALKF
jgi:hypothetical protein